MTTQPESSFVEPSAPKAFRASEDILKLVRQHVPWETLQDLNRARRLYTTTWQEEKDFDFDKELNMLKALYSAVKVEYDISMKQLEEAEMEENLNEDDVKYRNLNYRIACIYEILSPVKSFIHRLESAKPAPPRAFRASEDILKLVRQHVHWETLEDLNMARQLYTKTWREKKDFDIEKELDKLKALHSALEKEYDICLEQLQEAEMEENVEEDDVKDRDLNHRMACICEIFCPVKHFIVYLESAKPVSKVVEYEDHSGKYDTKEKKRKRSLERARIEEVLLSVLTHLCGETGIGKKISSRECSSRWDGIVNELHALVG